MSWSSTRTTPTSLLCAGLTATGILLPSPNFGSESLWAYEVGYRGQPTARTSISLTAFYARCIEATLRIAERHEGKTVVLVAHGGVMDCLYRAATRVPLDAPRIWQLDNAAINRLLHTSSGLTLVGWNDTSHLDVGAPTLDESADRMPVAAALAARAD